MARPPRPPRRQHAPRDRTAIAVALALLAGVLPGCYAFRLEPSPYPGPMVTAGVLTGRDYLGRYDVYLEQRRDGTALLAVAPGPNAPPEEATPYPTSTLHQGRWYLDEDERGLERWVLDVDGWPAMKLRRNFYWTRYETHARFIDPPTPPSACNDWGTVFALVSSDPTQR